MQGWPAEIGSSRGAEDDNSELSPRSGGFLFGGAGHDAEHFFLAHDDEIFAVQLDLGAGILAEQDAVAFFHIEGVDLALLINFALANGDDFALLGLVLRGVRDDDATAGGFSFFHATDQNAVVERGEFSHKGADSFRLTLMFIAG